MLGRGYIATKARRCTGGVRRRPVPARPSARGNSRRSWLATLDQWEIPADFEALVLVKGQPRRRTQGMLRRGRVRQIIRPLLEGLPHLLYVPVPVVNRSHAAIGMAEHSFDELVARIAEALREARRDGPAQIVRAELLSE